MTPEACLTQLSPDPNLMEDVVFVHCEICSEIIAKTDLARIHRPITVDMFTSFDELHGAPVPFVPGTEFQHMKCPHCRWRFAVNETQIKTSKGLFQVPEENFVDYAETILKELQTKAIENHFAPNKPVIDMINDMQDGAAVARVAHTHKVEGSIPSPAPNKYPTLQPPQSQTKPQRKPQQKPQNNPKGAGK